MTQEGYGLGGLGGGLSGGLKAAAVALLLQQLWKHAHSEQSQAPAQPATQGNTTTGGGLGGLLGGLFGGSHSGGMASSTGGGGGLGGLLSGPILGGLGGLLSHLQGQGLGRQVNSWVSSGPNQPVSPQELENAFDPQEVEEVARQAGTDRGSLMQELSRMLPQMVDRMTPQGRLPQAGEKPDPASFDDLLGGKTAGREGGPKGPI